MNNFNKETVKEYAENILIELTDEEVSSIIEEFNELTKQMDKISKIPNINDVEPLTHPFDLFETTLREDKSEEGEDIEDILKNADRVEGREIEVPKVVG